MDLLSQRKNGIFTDLKLLLKDELTIDVHKNILASESSYFKDALLKFEGEEKETFDLSGVRFDNTTTSALIDLIYSSLSYEFDIMKWLIYTVEESGICIQSILDAADYFNVQSASKSLNEAMLKYSPSSIDSEPICKSLDAFTLKNWKRGDIYPVIALKNELGKDILTISKWLSTKYLIRFSQMLISSSVSPLSSIDMYNMLEQRYKSSGVPNEELILIREFMLENIDNLEYDSAFLSQAMAGSDSEMVTRCLLDCIKKFQREGCIKKPMLPFAHSYFRLQEGSTLTIKVNESIAITARCDGQYHTFSFTSGFVSCRVIVSETLPSGVIKIFHQKAVLRNDSWKIHALESGVKYRIDLILD